MRLPAVAPEGSARAATLKSRIGTGIRVFVLGFQGAKGGSAVPHVATKPTLVGWAILIWVAALGVGFATLWRYESTPGVAGAPSARWPVDTAIERPRGLPTLLMFAHPQCVCTRASLTELERLKGRFEGRLAVYVVLLRPADAGEDWDRSDLWDKAAHLSGATVVRDLDGREAIRFGAVTSGQTLVYDAQGRLLFSGGLTAARGREGEALGARRIASLLTTGQADRAGSPVFGCALRQGQITGVPSFEPAGERGRR